MGQIDSKCKYIIGRVAHTLTKKLRSIGPITGSQDPENEENAPETPNIVRINRWSNLSLSLIHI